MGREGHRCYFIFGSAIMEIVTPVFKDRLNNESNGNLQAFMNTPYVIHKMFHLRHRYIRCCLDQQNCTNNSVLPLNKNQWNDLYTENPGQGRHYCHCKYTAKPIQLDDLDVTLAGLILINCCNLSGQDEQAIRILRQYRNDYFAHNRDGTIDQTVFDKLWPFLTAYVLMLDNSKQNDLAMLLNRPLDESLCKKYAIQLLDVHEKLHEMDNSIEENNVLTQQNNNLLSELTISTEENNILIQATRNIVTECTAENNGITRENNELLRELLHHKKSQRLNTCTSQREVKSRPYQLGQSIFELYHKTDLATEFSGLGSALIKEGVMMDDGRLVLCHLNMNRLLICNKDVSAVYSIPVNGKPLCVTVVNNTTVAVTLWNREFIEMFDINNGNKLKSIQVPGMATWGIISINNKLVVCGENCLYIIDHQTGKKLRTIHTGDCDPIHLHAFGNRIFYCGGFPDKNLYCYNFFEDTFITTMLPSAPYRMTSLHDGSLYALCEGGSLQHVSSDGQQYKSITTQQLKYCYVISYNPKQKKMLTCNTYTLTLKIYKEN